MKTMIDLFKRRQQVLLLSVIGVLVVIIITLVWVIKGDSRKPHSEAKLDHKTSLTTGMGRVNSQEVWVHKFTNEADLTKKRLEAVEQALDKLLKMNGQVQVSLHKTKDSVKNEFNETQQPFPTEAETLRSELHQVKKEERSSSQVTFYQKDQVFPQPPLTESSDGLVVGKKGDSVASHPHFQSKAVQKVSIRLHNSKANTLLKTTDNTIPAGAFAKAILLGGVDASTSIHSSSDPRPVLLRVTDPGTLPRKFKSDLKGCHVLAASYGDISSERVFMRLEKLTCIERKTGEVVEMNVQGYVAGEDGRAGLRGSVVDRAGESMRNALVGGFFSGMGSFLSQAHNPVTFSPMNGLAQTNPLTNESILKHGAAKGTSNALEKYADFYIKRAEQLQPVIQVAAGRPVDIVFSQGLAFGDSAIRHAVGKINDQKRHQQIQTVEENPTSVQAWIPSETISPQNPSQGGS
ncbi:MAG: TraB/VirB10 family protein [Alphaproteobacteria bacterium]|nr:TraB/VirB10 family protein [Alphaproteobacteria bacterium]